MQAYELKAAQVLASFLPDYRLDTKRSQGVQIWLVHKSGDGRELYVHTQNPRKWEVNLEWPRHHEPKNVVKSIGVSPVRGMEAIAKDITRRLLGHYDAAYAECLARQQQSQDKHNARLKVRDDLAAALGLERIRANEQFDVTAYRYGVDSFRINSERIDLDLDLPVDVAFELVEWLKKRMPERKFNH